MSYSLFPHQEECVSFSEGKKAVYLAIPCGGGKTLTSLHITKEYENILIICPASLCQLWEDEIVKWFGEQSILIIPNTKHVILPHKYLITSYEKACSPFIFKQLLKLNYDAAIVDESHRIKNPKSKRTEALIGSSSGKARILKKDTLKKVLFLSGTPMMQRPIELYPILKSYGFLEEWNYYQYGIYFCQGYKNDFMGWIMTGCSNLEKLSEICKDFIIRIPKEQVEKDLPSISKQIIRFDVCQKLVEQEKKYGLDSLDDLQHAVAFEGLSELRHLMAVEKANFAISFINDLLLSYKKPIIFTWHRAVFDIVNREVFPNTKGLKVLIDGSVSPSKRVLLTKQFNESEKSVAICQLKAASEGLSLHTADCVIFLESSWNPADNEQAIKRAHRKGQTNHLDVKYLVVKNSLDNIVLHKVLTKEINTDKFNSLLSDGVTQ